MARYNYSPVPGSTADSAREADRANLRLGLRQEAADARARIRSAQEIIDRAWATDDVQAAFRTRDEQAARLARIEARIEALD